MPSIATNALSLSRSSQLNTKLIPLLAFFIPLSTSIANILWAIFMLAWLIEGNFQQKASYIWRHKACYSTIIVFFSLVIASIYSTAEWPAIMLYLKKMIKLVYLPFLLYYFQQPQQRSATINAIILAGLVTVVFGILKHDYNPFKNSIDTALITLISSWLLINKLTRQQNRYASIAIIMLVALNIYYLYFFSIGKTCMALTLILIPVMLWQKSYHENINLKRSSILCLPVIIVFLILAWYHSFSLQTCFNHVVKSYNNYKNNPIDYDINTVSLRLTFYKNSLQLIKQRPLVGWGTGSFPIAYKNHVDANQLISADKAHFLYPNNPHNQYLSFGVQLGVYGFFLLFWLFYTLFTTSFLLPKREQYILQGIVVIIASGCLLNSWLMDFVAGNLFVILVALSLGALPHASITRDNQTI